MLNSSSINCISKIKECNVIWNQDILLIELKKCKGLIKKQVYHGEDVECGCDILFQNNVLANIHGNYCCPTCQHLISEGYGFNDSNRILTTSVIDSQDSNLELEESLMKLKPLLNLFQDGLYAISRLECYPTDGEGNFFWTCTNKDRLYKTTGPTYIEIGRYGFCPSHFLYPSQSLSSLNNKALEKYRDMIEDGYTPTGLAYEMNNGISLLLDGHHRATAACITNTPINMLMIYNVHCTYNHTNKQHEIWIAGNSYGGKELESYSKIKEYSENYINNLKNKKFPKHRVGNECNISNHHLDNKLQKVLDSNSLKYPIYDELCFFDYIEETSFSRLEYLWNKRDEDSVFEFNILFNWLYKYRKQECFTYFVKAINDLSKHNKIDVYFKRLLTYDYSKIEDILVEYLISLYDKDRLNVQEKKAKILIDKYFYENQFN